MKQCIRCGFVTDKFYRSSNRRKCITCVLKINKEWRDRQPKGYNTKYKLKNRYGTTKNEIEHKIISQERICPICEKDIDTVNGAVDHCHTTKRFRGVIHRECNLAIGLLEDNPEWCDNAARYLRT